MIRAIRALCEGDRRFASEPRTLGSEMGGTHSFHFIQTQTNKMHTENTTPKQNSHKQISGSKASWFSKWKLCLAWLDGNCWLARGSAHRQAMEQCWTFFACIDDWNKNTYTYTYACTLFCLIMGWKTPKGFNMGWNMPKMGWNMPKMGLKNA